MSGALPPAVSAATAVNIPVCPLPGAPTPSPAAGSLKGRVCDGCQLWGGLAGTHRHKRTFQKGQFPSSGGQGGAGCHGDGPRLPACRGDSGGPREWGMREDFQDTCCRASRPPRIIRLRLGVRNTPRPLSAAAQLWPPHNGALSGLGDRGGPGPRLCTLLLWMGSCGEATAAR